MAHHMLPVERCNFASALPNELHSMFWITVHPDHLSRAVLEQVDWVLVTGRDPSHSLKQFATALQRAAPPVDVQDLDSGETLLWDCRNDTPVQKIYIDPPRERQPRHKRKYAQGDLGPESSFYFHGPEQTLKLRANNLITFLQIADGVDDATWEYHLRRGDYSNWFRTSIKDPQLAKAAQQVERDTSDRSPESRSRIRAIVKERYTGSV